MIIEEYALGENGEIQEIISEVKNMKRIGTILPGSSACPGGNDCEFDDIRNELRDRNVVWKETEVGNGTVFWFYESELSKLPIDAERQGSSKFPQYLPVDEDSGHSIACVDRYLEAHGA